MKRAKFLILIAMGFTGCGLPSKITVPQIATAPDSLSTPIGSAPISPSPAPSGSPFAGGTGTADDPFQISTAEEFLAVDGGDQRYVLTADIDLSQVKTQIQGFGGVLDGQGFSLIGYETRDAAASNVGLFVTNSGTLKNFSFTGFSVTGSSYVGALTSQNLGVIDHVTIAGKVLATDLSYFVGALAAVNSGSISNVSADVEVYGGSDIGGLLGSQTSGSIVNSTITGSVSGSGGNKGCAVGWISGGTTLGLTSPGCSLAIIGGSS